MEQQATVKQVYENGTALIVVKRKSACAGDCDSCRGCAHPETYLELAVRNPAGARAGDVVKVTSESRRILGLAALLYLMPVVLMIAAYIIAPGSEGVRILCALAGLFAGLALCVAVSRRMRDKRAVDVSISEIVRRAGEGY